MDMEFLESASPNASDPSVFRKSSKHISTLLEGIWLRLSRKFVALLAADLRDTKVADLNIGVDAVATKCSALRFFLQHHEGVVDGVAICKLTQEVDAKKSFGRAVKLETVFKDVTWLHSDCVQDFNEAKQSTLGLRTLAASNILISALFQPLSDSADRGQVVEAVYKSKVTPMGVTLHPDLELARKNCSKATA